MIKSPTKYPLCIDEELVGRNLLFRPFDFATTNFDFKPKESSKLLNVKTHAEFDFKIFDKTISCFEILNKANRAAVWTFKLNYTSNKCFWKTLKKWRRKVLEDPNFWRSLTRP